MYERPPHRFVKITKYHGRHGSDFTKNIINTIARLTSDGEILLHSRDTSYIASNPFDFDYIGLDDATNIDFREQHNEKPNI